MEKTLSCEQALKEELQPFCLSHSMQSNYSSVDPIFEVTSFKFLFVFSSSAIVGAW